MTIKLEKADNQKRAKHGRSVHLSREIKHLVQQGLSSLQLPLSYSLANSIESSAHPIFCLSAFLSAKFC
ncbi:hypothetical protein ACTXT7_011320 [Hymenolepis weldensis]